MPARKSPAVVISAFVVGALVVAIGLAPSDHNRAPAQVVTPQIGQTRAPAESEEVAQLCLEVQRLQGLLNQMRTNLAFVQSSQTPLKHQFELEADAWQVIVDEMKMRLKRLEVSDNASPRR